MTKENHYKGIHTFRYSFKFSEKNIGIVRILSKLIYKIGFLFLFSVAQHSQSQKMQQQQQQQPSHGGPPPPHKPHAQQISLEKHNERSYHLEKQQPPSVQQSSHIAENMYRMPMSLASGMLTISPQNQQVAKVDRF